MYLGGLGHDPESEHLVSRQEVGTALGCEHVAIVEQRRQQAGQPTAPRRGSCVHHVRQARVQAQEILKQANSSADALRDQIVNEARSEAGPVTLGHSAQHGG